MESLDNKAKLAKKIALISQKLGITDADGRNNQGQGYNYITYEAVEGKLREVELEIGLTIYPEILELNEIQTPFVTSAGKDSTWTRTVLKMQFEIVDTETGHSETKLWFSADQDTGGKSMPQAVTEGCKRFKMKLFKFSSKGDIDPDDKTTKNQSQKSQNNDRKATAPQVNFMAKKLFDKAMESKIVLEKFKVKNIEDVTMSEVNNVLEFIDNYKPK